jgi:hypothetical protein
MSEQNVGKPFDNPENVKEMDQEPIDQAGEPGYYGGQTPADIINVQEPTLQGETIVVESVESKVIPDKTHDSDNSGSLAALLSREEAERFRTCWNEIQGKFVDDPCIAVEEADALVSEVIEQITQLFTHEHNSLVSQWKQGNDVSTEDLRMALKHYRSFFNRLVV